jgi:hypothetical protein
MIEKGAFVRLGKCCSSTRNSSFNDCKERIIKKKSNQRKISI